VSALDTSVHSELATKATSDDVKTVDTKVVGVKTDLDATREDLKMARSEMGTLIARNHDEIDQLRRLGERDYVEFTIVGRNKPQKVGNVTVELKGINEKHNQFSAAVTIEDRRFEKKNRAMNEPIFFYLSGTHIPEEIVVNKVARIPSAATSASRRRIRKRPHPRRQSLATKFFEQRPGEFAGRETRRAERSARLFFRGAQVIFRIPVE